MNRTAVSVALIAGLCTAAAVTYADPQPAQPSSFQDWGLLVAVAVAAGAAIRAGVILGHIQGTVKEWGKRLQDHSDQLSVMPILMDQIKQEIVGLKVAIELKDKNG